MAYGMASQTGGALTLTSEIGRGTVAELRLPLTVTGPGAHHVVQAVDDNGLVLLNTVMMLEDLGHTIFEAGSDRQALELLGREPAIELVVPDVAMPHMSGLELFGVARGLYPRLRFVLATGYARTSEDGDPGLVRLTKPFGQGDLAAAIEVAMGAAPQAPSS